MTLPILIISEFSFSTKLQIKSSPSWDYESIWCRLLKVAFWNGLNGNELIYVFGPEISARQGLINRPHKSLMRKFAHFLKVSGGSLSRAYPPQLKTNPASVASEQLRGCKECFQQGFHSALYQLTILEKCPLHDTPLREGCPSCQFPERYAINRNFQRHGYRCSRCHQSIVNFHAIPSPTFLSLLPRLSNWHLFVVSAMPYPFDSLRMIDQCWVAAIREWSAKYGEIPNLWQPKTALLSTLSNLIGEDSHDQTNRIFKDTGQFYFRMRRIIRQMVIKQDRRRIQPLTYSQSLETSGSQTLSYAYDIWRMAWERSLISESTPNYLKDAQLPITLLRWICSRMINYEDTDSLIIHKCRHEITASYVRCLELSQWLERKGGYLTSPLEFQLIIPRLCILNRR